MAITTTEDALCRNNDTVTWLCPLPCHNAPVRQSISALNLSFSEVQTDLANLPNLADKIKLFCQINSVKIKSPLNQNLKFKI